MSKEWDFLKDMNVSLFYYTYSDSISLEDLYQAFKERMRREGSEKKKRKKFMKPEPHGIICDKCKKSDKVKIGPGAYGTDCWCSRCKLGWEQAA